MHDVALESVAAVTIHPADAFVRKYVAREHIWRFGDEMTFESSRWRHLVLRNQM